MIGRSLRTILVAVGALVMANNASAQLVTYKWPKQATFSDKYQVFVKCGGEPECEVQVLMSNARYGGDYRAKEIKGRTFSFVPVSYGKGKGPLLVRVVKRFGGASIKATLHPRSYGYQPKLSSNGREVSFAVDSPNRYMSVHFHGKDNETASCRWIKHMFCFFVDPLETGAPKIDEPGVVVYAKGAELKNAKTIYFPPGYHNLREYSHRTIDEDGQLFVQDRQALYLAGGAFVEGIISDKNHGKRNTGMRVSGRGILTGRQYLWRNHPDHKGPSYSHILGIGNHGEVNGITVMESPNHGIVGATTKVTNVKFLGWHCNNDGVRVGPNSEISHSFIRAVDDHFYNFKIHVHDVVLWAGHNGGILTYGWGGQPTGARDGKTYNSGASLLENIDIIHPEWTGLGNNNGLVMAQVGFDYKPYGYGGDATTILRNIRIEGSIPGLVNLKPRMASGNKITAVPVAPEKIGYLGDLILENITIDSQFGKGRILGKKAASTDGKKTFYVQNVQFKNICFGTTPVTEANKDEFFDIEAETTRNIRFVK